MAKKTRQSRGHSTPTDTADRVTRLLLLPLLSSVILFAACTAEGADAETNETGIDAARGPSADAPVHPLFTLSQADIAALVADLPEEYATTIRSRPQVFLELVYRVLTGSVEPAGSSGPEQTSSVNGAGSGAGSDREGDADVLRLVDKNHLIGPEYAPDDIVPLNRFPETLTINRDDLSLRAVVLPDLFAMVEAARQDGIILDISSTYRSYEYQDGLFRYWVDELGLEEAERVSARPGSSQHQLGTTIDFGSITDEFARHPAGLWLARHAWEFGFSLSYPQGWEDRTGYKYEPWHYRWISRPATTLERLYFGGVQQVMLEFFETRLDLLEKALR